MGVTDITQRQNTLKFTLSVVEVGAVVKVCGLSKYRQRIRLAAGEVPCITLALRRDENVLEAALSLVEDLKLAREETAGQDGNQEGETP